MKLKVHYRALTEIFSKEDRWLYTAYTLLKSQTEGFTRKPGFLYSKELRPFCEHIGTSTSTLNKRLNKLSKSGYIQKTEFGYILTNTNTVLNNNLNFKQSKKNKDDTLYHPHKSIETPITNDQYIIDLIMLYFLLKQISQRQSNANGLNVTTTRKRKNINKNAPESLTIALEYLRKAGKYKSKTTVDRMLNDLQKINLIKITKGEWIEENERYTMNKYQIHNLSKMKIENLYKKTPSSNIEPEIVID